MSGPDLVSEVNRLQEEVLRLESLLGDFDDLGRCEECLSVWQYDDLTDVSGDNFCPRCVDEARRKDAEEAAQAKEDERESREIHINNMRDAG